MAGNAVERDRTNKANVSSSSPVKNGKQAVERSRRDFGSPVKEPKVVDGLDGYVSRLSVRFTRRKTNCLIETWKLCG
jgi:hypothetical protein